MGIAARLMQNVIACAIYLVAVHIWRDRKLFRVVTIIRYYLALSEVDVDRLAAQETSAMDLEELLSLSHAANRMGRQ